MKESSDDKTKNVITIGDSMLNNVNSRGLSKSKTVEVLNFPEATSSDIINKMDDILEDKPQSLIVHLWVCVCMCVCVCVCLCLFPFTVKASPD